MKSLYTLTNFIQALHELSEKDFSDVACIKNFLAEHLVEPGTLEPYLQWHKQHYTRNLIDRTPLYELIAICWESGQMSAIHDHKDQHCWMIPPIGRLMVENYRVISQDLAAGRCVLERADEAPMNTQEPQAVDPLNPVHRVCNPKKYNSRAVSLHLYSRPIDNCIVYSEQTNKCGFVTLSYTSIPGQQQDITNRCVQRH